MEIDAQIEYVHTARRLRICLLHLSFCQGKFPRAMGTFTCACNPFLSAGSTFFRT